MRWERQRQWRAKRGAGSRRCGVLVWQAQVVCVRLHKSYAAPQQAVALGLGPIADHVRVYTAGSAQYTAYDNTTTPGPPKQAHSGRQEKICSCTSWLPCPKSPEARRVEYPATAQRAHISCSPLPASDQTTRQNVGHLGGTKRRRDYSTDLCVCARLRSATTRATSAYNFNSPARGTQTVLRALRPDPRACSCSY